MYSSSEYNQYLLYCATVDCSSSGRNITRKKLESLESICGPPTDPLLALACTSFQLINASDSQLDLAQVTVNIITRQPSKKKQARSDATMGNILPINADKKQRIEGNCIQCTVYCILVSI